MVKELICRREKNQLLSFKIVIPKTRGMILQVGMLLCRWEGGNG